MALKDTQIKSGQETQPHQTKYHTLAILMLQRRIADLWGQAAADVVVTVNWAPMYKTLLAELAA